MKLSDAIAMGRVLLVPQAGLHFTADGHGCAIGMAARAAGLRLVPEVRVEDCNSQIIMATWPFLDQRQSLPCFCEGGLSIYYCITHLFDRHVMDEQSWTLDQLIDWVRSVEPPEEAECAVAIPVGEEVCSAT